VQGIFPKAFKQSIITPVCKGGDRRIVTNYRPISVLSALSKLLEKALNNRLMNYLEHFNILSGNQFGFRSGKSTEDAVTNLVDYVTSHIDAGKRCLGVFLDLAKAFETVSIPTLVNKLERVGIRENALKLFSDFLTDRKQRVKIII
jgi:hypothetical protein